MFPYRATTLIISICLVVAMLFGFYFWARGNGMAAERKRSGAALEVCAADRATLSNALDEVNAAAAGAKREAAQQQAKAEQAVAGAKQDAKGYQSRIDSIAVELEHAKRQPSCRAQLEQTVCVPLH